MEENRKRRKRTHLKGFLRDNESQQLFGIKLTAPRSDTKRKCRRRCVANPRDCMARAFQLHLERIVENTMIFKSQFPDKLISEGYLTEDECCFIRERPNVKDRIRKLMVIIRGRGLKCMEYLLQYFEKDYKDLAADVHNCYKDLIDQGYRDKDCLRCKMKTDVDIKTVADRLHTVDVISRKLYNEIVMTDAPIGGQDMLWDKLIDDIESNTQPKTAFTWLKSCLSDKGHYTHLADDMEYFLVDGCKMSECICNVQLRPKSACSSNSASSNSTEPVTPVNSRSMYSVELRSRLLETVSARPKAMYFTSDRLIGEAFLEHSGDFKLRPCRARNNEKRKAIYIPSDCTMSEPILHFYGDVKLRHNKTRRYNVRREAFYIMSQNEERFLTDMILELERWLDEFLLEYKTDLERRQSRAERSSGQSKASYIRPQMDEK